MSDTITRDRTVPLDVWLEIPDDDNPEGEARHEANVFLTKDFRFDVRWYSTAVGQVTHQVFDTYAEAQSWLERSGYQDFSS